MTTSKKINKFPHVKIIWEDIQQSNEAWIDEENILENDIAICEDTGYVSKSQKQNCGYSLPILMMMMENYP